MSESVACCSTPYQAWRSPSAHAFFWVVVLLATLADLATKWWAFHFIQIGENVTVLPGLLHFRVVENRGAVFGIGQGMRWLFIAASLVAVIFILQLFAHSRSRQRVFHFLLALVLGGAFGNLYDRILYGKVRDFIYFSIQIGDQRELWPWIFNVADVALVVGVGGLLLGWMIGRFDVTGTCCTVARPVDLPGNPKLPDNDRQ